MQILLDKGYKHYKTHEQPLGSSGHITTHYYQRRVDKDVAWLGQWLCACNEKLHLNVSVTTYLMLGKEHQRWEIEMCSESPVYEEWCKLKIYSLPVEKLVDIDKYEIRMRNLWQEFNKGV